MPRKKYRIILDTNLWIKFLLSGGMDPIETLMAEEVIEIIVSPELVAEIEDVTGRPKFSKIITPHKKRAIKHFINNYAIHITPISEIQICRDPKDNFILSLAQDAHADFILTGDKDLLVLESISKTRIVSYSDFLSLMLEE